MIERGAFTFVSLAGFAALVDEGYTYIFAFIVLLALSVAWTWLIPARSAASPQAGRSD
jgi:hypothetical protein